MLLALFLSGWLLVSLSVLLFTASLGHMARRGDEQLEALSADAPGETRDAPEPARTATAA